MSYKSFLEGVNISLIFLLIPITACALQFYLPFCKLVHSHFSRTAFPLDAICFPNTHQHFPSPNHHYLETVISSMSNVYFKIFLNSTKSTIFRLLFLLHIPMRVFKKSANCAVRLFPFYTLYIIHNVEFKKQNFIILYILVYEYIYVYPRCIF